jgi:hypothetical protein
MPLHELGYSGMVVNFFTTRGKEDRTYPWRCVTQIFQRDDFNILIVNIFHLDAASCHQHYIRSIHLSVDTVFRACGSCYEFR